MKKCIICKEGPREVPNREVTGRPIKKVCRKCHGELLRGDLAHVLACHAARKAREGNVAE